MKKQEKDSLPTAEAVTHPDDHDGPMIEVKNLTKSFGSNTVLDGLSIELQKGENLVVLGKSGTGKSVLIKCLVGLEYPDNGEIKVLGENVAKLKYRKLNELRKHIGFLFQSAALYDSMTVRKNMEFPLRKVARMRDESEITEKVEKVLEAVGLADAIDKMPSELSGGMRKRAGLARTLIMDPALMLYDEPTTGLDPVTSSEISELINDVQKRFNTSSIIITHDIGCARTTANRIAMLRGGKVYVEGTFDELEKSDDEWVQDFFKNQ
jgi:phospholipid/cholesterol/gamma-HCH transport system ATP-binding protein